MKIIRQWLDSPVHKLFPLVLLLMSLFLLGCPKPPEKELSDAEKSLREAAVVSECAEKEFQEAEQMLNDAKRLVEEGRYDEAEVKAKAAKSLAERAKKVGEDNWEECQKAKNTVVNKDPNEGKVDAADNTRLETIFFAYNEAVLSDDAQNILQANAEWMRRNPTSKVVIKGHCDERGSTEYNIALGERRAESVRKYLVQLGIDPGRMSIVSFGEEMPLARGTNDDAHAQNRRAEFEPR